MIIQTKTHLPIPSHLKMPEQNFATCNDKELINFLERVCNLLELNLIGNQDITFKVERKCEELIYDKQTICGANIRILSLAENIPFGIDVANVSLVLKENEFIVTVSGSGPIAAYGNDRLAKPRNEALDLIVQACNKIDVSKD